SIRGAPAVQLTERAFVRPFVIERRPPVGSADLPSRRSIYSAAMSNTYPLVARPNAVGFTLLELLTAIAVLGVLLAIGVPAFTETIRTNRLAAQANDVVQALSMARSEASKRGIPVAVCAANADQSGCAGDTADDWANGWIVFTDDGATPGSLENGELVLQTSRRVADEMQLSTNNLGFVRYAANGGTTNAAATPIGTAVIVFELRPNTCTGTNVRRITVERTGRANLSRLSCS